MVDRRRMHLAFAALTAFVIPWIHGLATSFVYDAAQYWNGAATLVSGGDVITAGALATRGVYTPIVHLLPALAAAPFGPSAAPIVVLIWNSVLVSLAAVLLIPRFSGALAGGDVAAPSVPRIWVSAIIGSAVLSGFARFPLVDLASTLLALAALYGFFVATRWRAAILTGLCAAVSINLRPAIAPAIVLAAVVIVFVRVRPTLLAAVGALVALIPQLIFNVAAWGQWSVVPRETGPLSAVQARWAPFALRYDTVLSAERAPQQWYCDSSYARALSADASAQNQFDVIRSLVQHFPGSLWFLVRKVSINLHWSTGTPYEPTPGAGELVVALGVVALAAFGIASILCLLPIRTTRDRRVHVLATVAFWVGAVATLAISTPETRFALPVVAVGVVGVVTLVPEGEASRNWRRRVIASLIVGAALAACVAISGAEGLTHALPPGGLRDAQECAAAGR